MELLNPDQPAGENEQDGLLDSRFRESAQQITPFSGGVVVGTHQPKAARELLDFLASPEAIAAIKASGLDPAPR